jgi:hypothetical protein
MPATAATGTTSEIRAWAIAQGLPVSVRGRLKPEVVEAYTEAHGDRPVSLEEPVAPIEPVLPDGTPLVAKKAGPPRRRATPVAPVVPVVTQPEPVVESVESRIEDLERQLTKALARIAVLEETRVRVVKVTDKKKTRKGKK